MLTNSATTTAAGTGSSLPARSGPAPGAALSTLPAYALRRDPRAVPGLLRGARPPAHPLGVAGPGRARPVRAAHDRRDAPAQAVLPGPRAAAAPPADLLPEVLPDARHRAGR